MQPSRSYSIDTIPNGNILMGGTISTGNNTMFEGQDVGGMQDLRILGVGRTGDIISDFRIGTEYDDRIFGICRTNSGNSMLVGHLGQSFAGLERNAKRPPYDTIGGASVFLLLNPNAVPLGVKLYDFGPGSDDSYSIVSKDNDGFVFVGRSYSQTTGKNEILLGKLDGLGDLQNAKRIRDIQHSRNFQPVQVLKTLNGGFTVLACTDKHYGQFMNSPDPIGYPVIASELVIVQFDSNMNPLASKEYHFQAANDIRLNAREMLEDEQGNLIIVGSSALGGWVLKLNNQGGIVGAKLLSPNSGNSKICLQSIAKSGNGFSIIGQLFNNDIVVKIEVNSTFTILSSEIVATQSKVFDHKIRLSEAFLCGERTDALFSYNDSFPNCNIGLFPCQFSNVNMIASNIGLQSVSANWVDVPVSITPNSQNSNIVTICSSVSPETVSNGKAVSSPSPNPTDTEFSITIPDEIGAELQVFDLKGQTQIKQHLEVGTHTIPVEHLENGLYLVRIISPSGIRTHRLAIAR